MFSHLTLPRNKEFKLENMNATEPDVCIDCGERSINGLIFHEIFCYDVYLVSPPQQNTKHKEYDDYLAKNIVKPLEQNGFKCYHGSRNMIGGDYVIQALSKPITIIPITIVPVYKDKCFTAYWNLLLHPNYLDRIVFLKFDATQIQPLAVSKTCISFHVTDHYLLQKLMRTITEKRKHIPLHKRKLKFERNDPESTVSSGTSELHGQIPFQRFGRFQRSFRVKASVEDSTVCSGTSELHGQIPFQRFGRFQGSFRVKASSEGWNNTSEGPYLSGSLFDLLSHCCTSSAAAKTLARTIQKDISLFSKNGNLEQFEKQIRKLREKHNTLDFEKLYFWISAAIFYKIYKDHDSCLKVHMRTLTSSKCQASTMESERLFQAYSALTASLHAKMTSWSRKLDQNDEYVKTLENCLLMINYKLSEVPPHDLIKNLRLLPKDIKHICIVAITEKILQKKYMDLSPDLFPQICATVSKKQWLAFIDVLEIITEYMLGTFSEGTLQTSVQVVKDIFTWKSRRLRGKDEGLDAAFRHTISKLVYHSVDKVRSEVASLLFREGPTKIDTSQLGSCYYTVNEDLVKMCICEHLKQIYPDLTVIKPVPTSVPHSLIFEARMPEGDGMLYVYRQRTLNDVLQTNSTDASYESFQEMSKAFQLCQGLDNIVTLRNVSSNGTLPFFVVEHGKPLLSFLHEKDNQLTWTQLMDILVDITNAIHHCHSKNVILRDIIPDSFIVVPLENGSFKTKLASFLYAKCPYLEESSNAYLDYFDDLESLFFQGDQTQDVAVYFSAPETLLNQTFSKYSEAWMLAATFYSILFYGRRPFQELSHLSKPKFVKEIISTSSYSIKIPSFLPDDLAEILKRNLDFKTENRMVTETILEKLKECKNSLGTRMNAVHTVRSNCSFINSEDMLRGFVGANGNFVERYNQEPIEGCHFDKVTMIEKLTETVSVRMNLITRRKLLHLNHDNILGLNEIKCDPCTTTLISKEYDDHHFPLSRVNPDTGMKQLYSYLEQITLALQELHKHNILHCDLRCKYIYICPDKGTLKVGHFGRAVFLQGTQTSATKLMPADAAKWSAPEVRATGMYSKSSDVFNLAAVFWEAISTQNNIRYPGYPMKPFLECSSPMQQLGVYTILSFMSSTMRGNRNVACLIACLQHMSLPEDIYAEYIRFQWEDNFTKLLKCIQKCWSCNPIRRPDIESVLKEIQEIRKLSEEYLSPSEDIEHKAACQESTFQDTDGYEMIFEIQDSFFSVSEAWSEIIEELVYSEIIVNNTTSLMEIKETTCYQDLGLPVTKSKSKRLKTNVLL